MSDSAVQPARLHLRHVEGMRAFAALVVLFNHGFAQIWEGGKTAPPLLLRPLAYFMVLGHLAVAVFIVISGFCLMLPVVRGDGTLRGGARTFYLRRARRILPPYYGALALSLLLIWLIIGEPTGTLWDVSIAIRRSDLVSHLILTQDVFGTGRINYAFWSIATEWQIYFFFPLLVWAWMRAGPAPTVATALAAGYAIAIAAAGTRGARAHAQFLGLFTLGMLAAALVYARGGALARLRDRFPWGPVGLAAAALTAGLTLRWGWEEGVRHFVALDGIVATLTLCLLVLSSRSEGSRVRRFFSIPPLAWIGAFSYSLYLLHAPLLQVFWQYALRPLHLARPAQFGVLVAAGMPLILLASYAFYLVLEKPFIGAPAAQKTRQGPLFVPAP